MVAFFCLLSCGQEKVPVNDDNNQPTPIIPVLPQGPQEGVAEGGPGTRGWTTEVISNGLRLHKFDGNDIVTGKRQSVRVLDIDMSLERYRVEFTYTSGTGKTGTDMAKEKGAIASVNASYETGSVYIKINGVERHNIANDKIGSTDVANWKNDGAVYMTEGGKVYLEYSGKNKTLIQQRSYYRRHNCPNIFSSAPMLIDDYEQVGENFVPSNLTESQTNSYNYEHPYRHQGVTHPRTVYATTADDHLLLIAIDKDRQNGTVAGMSARDATKFLKYHFNPQYALNMDGGGSTAISVNGKIVNTPSESTGERAVPTYLLIFDNVKK